MRTCSATTSVGTKLKQAMSPFILGTRIQPILQIHRSLKAYHQNQVLLSHYSGFVWLVCLVTLSQRTIFHQQERLVKLRLQENICLKKVSLFAILTLMDLAVGTMK